MLVRQIRVLVLLAVVCTLLNDRLGLYLLSFHDYDEYLVQTARRRATTTELTGEPSHIRMCRHLLPRFEHALAIDQAQTKAAALGLSGMNLANIPELQMPDPIEMEYLIVEEDEDVCSDSASTTQSLLQIFGSTLLSAAAKRFKLNVEYQHNCPQWREKKGGGEDDTPVTMQEMLPGDLLNNAETKKVPMEVLAMKNICLGCMMELENNNGTVSKRNCVLFTRPTVYNPFSLMQGKKRQRRKKRPKYNTKPQAKIQSTNEQAALVVNLPPASEIVPDESDAMVTSEEATTNETPQSEPAVVTEADASKNEEPDPNTPAQDKEETPSTEPDQSEAPAATEEDPENEEEGDASNIQSERGRRALAENTVKLPQGIVAILPLMKTNLKSAAKVWHDGYVEFLGDEYTKQLENRPGNLVGPSKKDKEDNKPALKKGNAGEQGAYSKLTDDHAVIYLTCKKEDCKDEQFGDALAMPFYVYASEIPRSVSSITIVASQDCADNIDGCVTHGEALTSFLTNFYERANVQFLVEPSTYASFSRMISADYLVCPPGVSCVIPAMTMQGYSSLINNPNLVFWLPMLQVENVWNVKFLPMQAVPVTSVTGMDYERFLTKIPPGKIGVCRDLRGRRGHWVKDNKLAPELQYASPIRHYVGEADMKFLKTAETPYRPSSTYTWVENLFPTCEPQVMTLEGLCFAMAELDMDRIFIIGDSLTMNQAQSLWKLLGNEDNPTELGVRDPNWDRELECPNEDRSIIISFARNDQLMENDDPVDVASDTHNCFAFCYPWTQRYLDFEGSTLLVVNTGGHFQTHHQFQYAFREFVKTVDSMNRIYDIMFFRTSTPGHTECESMPEQPFGSYKEYAQTVSDEYSWDKFIGYNDYVTKLLDIRNREDVRGLNANDGGKNPTVVETIGSDNAGNSKAPKRMKMELLDVYPMTVLRQDGHVSGEVCEDCQSNGIHDCLHYFLPGPPDWWNHVLYSHILDLGRKG